MEIPGLVTRLFEYDAVLVRKCPVAPVPAMIGDSVMGVDGGEDATGSTVDVGNGELVLSMVFITVHRSYVLCVPQMHVEPPFLSQVVAALLWPSARWLQDCLVWQRFWVAGD
jgi:hypothetical protein